MRPDFGTTAPTLVFAPGSPANLRMLESSISDAVRSDEPRVELDSVVPSPPLARKPGGRIGHLPGQRTNTKANLVFRTTSTASAGEPDDLGAAPAGRPDLG
jgi:phage baseplate assembly protein W